MRRRSGVWKSQRTLVPCSKRYLPPTRSGAEAKVNQNDVAVKLLAYAFLSMHETGALELNLVEKKTLFVKSTSPTERVPERAADIEALRQAGAQRWAGFNTKDGALVEQVLKQCSSALNSRTASRNTDSSDF